MGKYKSLRHYTECFCRGEMVFSKLLESVHVLYINPVWDSLCEVTKCPGLLELSCFSLEGPTSWANSKETVCHGSPSVSPQWRERQREEEKGSLSELHSPLGSSPLTCPGPDLVTALFSSTRLCIESCLLCHLSLIQQILVKHSF